MPKKEKNFYIDALTKCVLYSNEATIFLEHCLENLSAHDLVKQLDRMHRIESAADIQKQVIMEHLMNEFLPPIDREDIVTLSQRIDKITNAIEEVLQGIYIFQITVVLSEVKEYTKLLRNCLTVLKDVMMELHHFRNPSSLQEKIMQINRLEEEGNRLYTKAIHRLYITKNDPLTVLSWTTIFDRLEKCCNCCEETANLVAWIIMKNT